jgi:hypothetical protein
MAAKTSAHTTVRLRVLVRNPIPGVAVAMQIGRDDLQPPKPATKTKLTFETQAKVACTPSGEMRLTGPAIQGPPSARFIYVNWGRRAGQKDTVWDRRAKVMLTTLDRKLLEACEAKAATLEAEIDGKGTDGGPCCATVPLLGGWRLA